MDNEKKPIESVNLGELKKEKTSKPLLVIFIFGVVITITILIPVINDSISDPDSFLGGLYYKVFNKEVPDNTPKGTENRVLLNQDTVIKHENFSLSKFDLEDDSIIYNVKSLDGTSDVLDTTSYYLELYDENQKVIKTIKLLGDITENSTNMIIVLPDMNFAKNSNYYGKILDITEFEEIDIPIHNGYGVLSCTKFAEEYKYLFQNNSLKRIEHKITDNNPSDEKNYLQSLSFYRTRADFFNNISPNMATVEETSIGFESLVTFDLATFDLSTMEYYYNYNFYNLNDEASRIKFEMIAKGFMCS